MKQIKILNKLNPKGDLSCQKNQPQLILQLINKI